MGECLPKAANICMIDTRPSIQQKTKWIINQGCTKLKFQLLYPPQFWKHFRTILKYCQRCDTTQCISSLSVFHSRFTHRPDSTSWNEPLTSVAFPNAHAPKIISYFECGICDYKSMNKYYMTDHEKRQHPGHQGSISFVCNVCYARKQNEYLLKKHMQQHVRSTCVICEKIFNTSKNLNRHGRVHQIQICEFQRKEGSQSSQERPQEEGRESGWFYWGRWVHFWRCGQPPRIGGWNIEPFVDDNKNWFQWRNIKIDVSFILPSIHHLSRSHTVHFSFRGA